MMGLDPQTIVALVALVNAIGTSVAIVIQAWRGTNGHVQPKAPTLPPPPTRPS